MIMAALPFAQLARAPQALIGCLLLGLAASFTPLTTCQHYPGAESGGYEAAELMGAHEQAPSPCVLNIKPMNTTTSSYSVAIATSSYTTNYVAR